MSTNERTYKTSEARRIGVRKAAQKHRAKLIAAGLCRDCGAEKIAAGHTLCDHCLEDRRAREKRKTRLRWAGRAHLVRSAAQ